MKSGDGWQVLIALGTIALAAVTSAALILLLRPLLARYALARPNARSSHVVPTPQGGGIAVMCNADWLALRQSYFPGSTSARSRQYWPRRCCWPLSGRSTT